MYMQLLWCKAASCGKVAWKETQVTGIMSLVVQVIIT